MFNGKLLALLVLFGTGGPTAAGPILSVDMDPVAPGVQTTLDVGLNSSFTIELMLNTDGQDILGVSFDLLPGTGSSGPMAATALRMNDALFGSGMFQTSILEAVLDDGSGQVSGSVARGLFGVPVNASALVVAAIDFTALEIGSFLMDLNNVHLSGAVGPDAPGIGAVTVSSVPAPGGVLLLLSGLGVWLGGGRRRCAIPSARRARA